MDGKGIIYLKGLRKGHYYFYLQQADPKRPALNEFSTLNSAKQNGPGESSLLGEVISSSAIANSVIGFGAGLMEATKVQWLRPTGYYYWSNPTLNTVNIGAAKNAGRVLVNTQSALKQAGKLTLVAGILFEGAQGLHNIHNGANATAEALKTTLDIKMGIVSAYFPVGTAIGATYFIFDTFVGWDNVR